MKLVFRDQTFSFELLRAIGYTVCDGADIGECLATAARIRAPRHTTPTNNPTRQTSPQAD
jgi:hypothetical protein